MLVEDDEEDSEIIITALTEIGVKNEIVCFRNGKDALDYLKKSVVQTFLILCDINMPLMNGLEFKEKIDEDHELRNRSIPFIFLSTSSQPSEVRKAFELKVQGYFRKSSDYNSLKSSLEHMINYWLHSLHPNSLAK
jgi:CheY-like chemotaxis protein